MKKITFILLALITGTAFGQESITSSAEIIEAISFVENNGLDFGRVDNTGGIVNITPAGVVTGKTQIPGNTPTAGQLTVSGEPNEAYILTISETAVLTHTTVSTETMNITGIASDITTPELDSSGEQIVNIGGELTVNDGQEPGVYSGTITVTVSYN